MEKYVKNLPFSDYLKIDALSQSSIKLFRECPAKYDLMKHGLLPNVQSKAQKLGSAFEVIVLEPEKKDFVVITECKTEATKEYKEAVENNPDKMVLTAGDGADIMRWAGCTADLMFAHDIKGEAQVSAFTEINEMAVKCRFDLIDHERKIIYDLKLMADASPESFSRDLYKYGYFVQAALYRLIAGKDYQFKFIVQEKHDYGTDDRFTALYSMYDTDYEVAETVIFETIEKIKNARELNDFYGYGQRQISLPKWAVSNV